MKHDHNWNILIPPYGDLGIYPHQIPQKFRCFHVEATLVNYSAQQKHAIKSWALEDFQANLVIDYL